MPEDVRSKEGLADIFWLPKHPQPFCHLADTRSGVDQVAKPTHRQRIGTESHGATSRLKAKNAASENERITNVVDAASAARIVIRST